MILRQELRRVQAMLPPFPNAATTGLASIPKPDSSPANISDVAPAEVGSAMLLASRYR